MSIGFWGVQPPPKNKKNFWVFCCYDVIGIWVKGIKSRVFSSMDHSRKMHTFRDTGGIYLSGMDFKRNL